MERQKFTSQVKEHIKTFLELEKGDTKLTKNNRSLRGDWGDDC